MAGRRSGSDDDGLAKRRRKQEPQQDQQQKQGKEPEKESALPEQDVYGNSFMVDAMRGSNDRSSDGVPNAGPTTEQQSVQGWGGIDDGGGPPRRPRAADHWFRPRFRNKKPDEDIESVDDEPEEPGLPEEDAEWIEGLEPTGERWTDPAPQPPARALDGGLRRWLIALFPLAGVRPAQFAIAKAILGHAELQERTGASLLGVAAAAALGSSVGHRAGSTHAGRLRLARGLAIAAAPEAPRDPARTALQISMMTADAGPVPAAPEDRWLARLISVRLGLDRPPIPELDDPPPAEPDAIEDDPVDMDAIFQSELGTPPDPSEALRAAALDGCEAQARWAVQLRSASAGIARALVEMGSDEAGLVSVLRRVDEQVTRSTGLLQEIAGAARAGTVPVRGLRNGLSRGAQSLAAAHRTALNGLLSCAAVGGAFGVLPEPTHPDIAGALSDGRPLPDQDVERLPEHDLLVGALEALDHGDAEAARVSGRALLDRALAQQNGVGCAAGALVQMRALVASGERERAMAIRDEMGALLLGAGARAGVSLLARWEA